MKYEKHSVGQIWVLLNSELMDGFAIFWLVLIFFTLSFSIRKVILLMNELIANQQEELRQQKEILEELKRINKS